MFESIRRSSSSFFHPDSNAVFTAFGEVAYAVQIFEADLVSLLIILKLIIHTEGQVKTAPESFLNRSSAEVWWRQESERLQCELDRNTLGQLLKNELKISRKSLDSIHDNGGNVMPPDKLNSINQQLDNLPIKDWVESLECRNNLFHGFFFHADDDLSHAEGCRELLNALEKDRKLFVEHGVKVRSAIISIMGVMGYEDGMLNGPTN